ncbi:MAG: hypothetical protein J1F64_02375 [Oscillospiraceae bacterium]|nr:hypothetical protein [Oscillospiraceae bacterium]
MQEKNKKEKKKIKILLPGFHTNTDWKMALAIIYYLSVTLFSLARSLDKGIILLIAFLSFAYLAYGIITLFSKQKKHLMMSVVYISVALVAIGADSVLMSGSGLTVSDLLSSPVRAQQAARGSGGSGSSGTKKSSSSSSSSSGSSKQTSGGGSSGTRSNTDAQAGGSPDTQTGGETNANGASNPELTDDDIFTVERDMENAFNADQNAFAGVESGYTMELYYVSKKSLIYHTDPECSALKKEALAVTKDEAAKRLLFPCGKCAKDREKK